MQLFDEYKKYYRLYHGSMLDLLEVIESNSIDSIITDPPYELNFMNKGWDNAGISFNKETWEKCLDVLKPGGYLLAFGGSRTFHRIACAIEDAGFEIRDTIMWLYGSGFPKSMNIGLAIDKKNGVDNRTGNIVQGAGSNNTNSMNCGNGESQEFKHFYEERKAQNEWNGWGTTLKPSYEPIIVARKPFKGSCMDNVIKYGVGGINIDECRVALKNEKLPTAGRFPANTILTYDETDYDEVCGGFPYTKTGTVKPCKNNTERKEIYGFSKDFKYYTSEHIGDEGSAARYFYCAKANKKDRDEGLDELDGKIPQKKNTHPTVKPTELMQYLVRLVTPQNGIILDPFNGSGSTGKAVMYENLEKDKNYKYIGIELNEDYLEISKARIDYVINKINEKESENKQITFNM